MSDKAIYSVDTVETITDNDKIYINTGDNIKQIKSSDLFIDINSNLSDLKVNDVAGGKNLANINDFKLLTTNPSRYGYEWLSMKGGTYTFNITNGNNALYIGYKHNGEFVNPNSVVNNSKVQTITISDGDDIVIWYENGVTENTVTKIQLEVGSVATEYEPYIPSIKMLADEVSEQNESLGAYAITNDMLEMGHWWNGGNTSNEHIRVKKEYSLQSGFKGYVTNNTEKQLSIIKYNEDAFVGSVKEIEAGKTILVEVPSGSNYRMYEVETDFSKIASNIIVATNGLGKEVAKLKNDLNSVIRWESIPSGQYNWTVRNLPKSKPCIVFFKNGSGTVVTEIIVTDESGNLVLGSSDTFTEGTYPIFVQS